MIDTPFNFLTQALRSGVNHEGPITHNTESTKSSLCSEWSLSSIRNMCFGHCHTQVKAGLWSSFTSQSQGRHCIFSWPGKSLKNHHFPSQHFLKLYFLRTCISLYVRVITPWLSKNREHKNATPTEIKKKILFASM